jgi:hypothetical protein
VAWIAHIIIYLLIDPPLSPFLNEVFIKLDDIWGMLEIGMHILAFLYVIFPQLCIITDLLHADFHSVTLGNVYSFLF